MTKHTPTPWPHDRAIPDLLRAIACVNAFPDDFPTEKITPGLVGRMRDLIKDMLSPAVVWSSVYQEQQELPEPHPTHQDMIDRARALLAEIEE